MNAASQKSLNELTAEDLMTRDVVVLPEELPLREAARRLIRNQVGGAPVVDSQGRCIGVLSSFDFLRIAERREDLSGPSDPRPITCSFQVKRRLADGRDVTLCTLAPGVCPIQTKQRGPTGEEMLVCSEPHCVLVDWQVVDVEKLPDLQVRNFMTADPVTVSTAVPIHTLAQMMIDAHIHRVIVVDEKRRPIGIVSSTDLLAALARNTSS